MHTFFTGLWTYMDRYVCDTALQQPLQPNNLNFVSFFHKRSPDGIFIWEGANESALTAGCGTCSCFCAVAYLRAIFMPVIATGSAVIYTPQRCSYKIRAIWARPAFG